MEQIVRPQFREKLSATGYCLNSWITNRGESRCSITGKAFRSFSRFSFHSLSPFVSLSPSRSFPLPYLPTCEHIKDDIDRYVPLPHRTAPPTPRTTRTLPPLHTHRFALIFSYDFNFLFIDRISIRISSNFLRMICSYWSIDRFIRLLFVSKCNSKKPSKYAATDRSSAVRQ